MTSNVIERTVREVADKIIEMMERDGLKWTKQWAHPRPACNGLSGHVYTGSNVLTTGITMMVMGVDDPRFLTFKQARMIGGAVKKGEKGTPIIFYRTLQREEDGEERRIPMARVSWLFHVSQCENLDPDRMVKPIVGQPRTSASRNTEIDAFVASAGVPVENAPAAFYVPSEDKIGMPDITMFPADDLYYSVLLHELTHATGHQSRLDRPSVAKPGRKNEDRAFEELIAEIGSAMLGQHLGLQVEPDENNAAYIKAWCQLLTDRPKAIFDAASAAGKAVSWLQERHNPLVEAA